MSEVTSAVTWTEKVDGQDVLIYAYSTPVGATFQAIVETAWGRVSSEPVLLPDTARELARRYIRAMQREFGS